MELCSNIKITKKNMKEMNSFIFLQTICCWFWHDFQAITWSLFSCQYLLKFHKFITHVVMICTSLHWQNALNRYKKLLLCPICPHTTGSSLIQIRNFLGIAVCGDSSVIHRNILLNRIIEIVGILKHWRHFKLSHFDEKVNNMPRTMKNL